MLRKFVGALVVCALLAPAGLWAAEIQGTVKSVDSSRNTITVTSDGKDRTFDCASGVQYLTLQTYRIRRPVWMSMSGGLSNASTGSSVTLVTQMRQGQEVVTEVRQEGSSSGRRRLLPLR